MRGRLAFLTLAVLFLPGLCTANERSRALRAQASQQIFSLDRDAAATGIDREPIDHENGGGEKTDITCAIISSRLANRLSS